MAALMLWVLMGERVHSFPPRLWGSRQERLLGSLLFLEGALCVPGEARAPLRCVCSLLGAVGFGGEGAL